VLEPSGWVVDEERIPARLLDWGLNGFKTRTLAHNEDYVRATAAVRNDLTSGS